MGKHWNRTIGGHDLTETERDYLISMCEAFGCATERQIQLARCTTTRRDAKVAFGVTGQRVYQSRVKVIRAGIRMAIRANENSPDIKAVFAGLIL